MDGLYWKTYWNGCFGGTTVFGNTHLKKLGSILDILAKPSKSLRGKESVFVGLTGQLGNVGVTKPPAGWCHTYIWLIFMVFICQSHIVCFGSLSCSLVKGNNKLMSCTMWLLQHMRPQPMRLKWKSSMQALLHDMNYFIPTFSSV